MKLSEVLSVLKGFSARRYDSVAHEDEYHRLDQCRLALVTGGAADPTMLNAAGLVAHALERLRSDDLEGAVSYADRAFWCVETL